MTPAPAWPPRPTTAAGLLFGELDRALERSTVEAGECDEPRRLVGVTRHREWSSRDPRYERLYGSGVRTAHP